MIEDHALSWWRFEWLLHVCKSLSLSKKLMTTLRCAEARATIVCNFSEAKLTNYAWFLVTLCNIYQLSISVCCHFFSPAGQSPVWVSAREIIWQDSPKKIISNYLIIITSSSHDVNIQWMKFFAAALLLIDMLYNAKWRNVKFTFECAALSMGWRWDKGIVQFPLAK